MPIQLYALLSLFLSISCTQPQSKNSPEIQQLAIINPNGTSIETRFKTPSGFERAPVQENSFAAYLRTLPLKPNGAEVHTYDGRIKRANGIYCAVVDMEIGTRDLQQCADAVMRLRGEYLYHSQQYDKIHFNFTNGFRVDYSEWMKGKRVKISGNNTSWVSSASPSNTYQDFRKYMDLIFAYAGTLSLSKELKAVDINDMQIGDVFIQGGSPGHAVIVVDMAQNPTTGEKLFMLAQSYMPAQDTQILINPDDNNMSPWYSLNFAGDLKTPEWTFHSSDLKRFE